MQLDPIDAEGAPPHPGCPRKARRVPDLLARVQDRKQGRVHDEGLGVPDELAYDPPPQGLQEEAPELPHPSVQRGRIEPHHTREQVREEPLLGVAQERALPLHATELLWKSASAMTSESESLLSDS